MNKPEILKKLAHLKTIMLAAATYGTTQEEDYENIRKSLLNESVLNNEIPEIIKASYTTSEVRMNMQNLFPHYKERRELIIAEINKLASFVENYGPNTSQLMQYKKTGWDKIDESVSILKHNLDDVTDRIAFNEIGVRCRETILLLSNEVYNDDLHHLKEFDGPISSSDSKRKLEGYIEYCFPGSSNKEKRQYAKACNDLANNLTHAQNLSKLDAKLCINATISLIQIIKLIYTETKN